MVGSSGGRGGNSDAPLAVLSGASRCGIVCSGGGGFTCTTSPSSFSVDTVAPIFSACASASHYTRNITASEVVGPKVVRERARTNEPVTEATHRSVHPATATAASRRPTHKCAPVLASAAQVDSIALSFGASREASSLCRRSRVRDVEHRGQTASQPPRPLCM